MHVVISGIIPRAAVEVAFIHTRDDGNDYEMSKHYLI